MSEIFQCSVCGQWRRGRCWGWDSRYKNLKAIGIGSRFAKEKDFKICWPCKQKLDKGKILKIDDDLWLNPK